MIKKIMAIIFIMISAFILIFLNPITIILYFIFKGFMVGVKAILLMLISYMAGFYILSVLKGDTK